MPYDGPMPQNLDCDLLVYVCDCDGGGVGTSTGWNLEWAGGKHAPYVLLSPDTSKKAKRTKKYLSAVCFDSNDSGTPVL